MSVLAPGPDGLCDSLEVEGRKQQKRLDKQLMTEGVMADGVGGELWRESDGRERREQKQILYRTNDRFSSLPVPVLWYYYPGCSDPYFPSR